MGPSGDHEPAAYREQGTAPLSLRRAGAGRRAPPILASGASESRVLLSVALERAPAHRTREGNRQERLLVDRDQHQLGARSR